MPHTALSADPKLPDPKLPDPKLPDPKLPDLKRPDLKRHDVLIVGGGLVGASLAIALDRVGVDVGLIDATPSGALAAVFDERNLSFSDATVNALTALGVLQRLRTTPGPIRRIHASRRGDFGRVRLDSADYGRTGFGQVVVARDFGAALETALQSLTHFTRYRPARFIGLEPQAEEGTDAQTRTVRIADDRGEHLLRTRLLVAADGTRSATRAALGIGSDDHDYGQSLFVARLRSERAPDGTAYERLGPDGPTALLPRGDRHYGVVHGVAAAEADAVAALDDAGFIARVQDAVGWRIGRLLSVGPRSRYDAVRVIARSTIAHRAVLVGNAAQTLHPIAAQGFNLGLRDALTLSEMIERDRVDPGAGGLLQGYAARRRDDRERTLAMTDGLARLGAGQSSWLRPLRSLGMLMLDRLPPVQASLVGGAMGYRGDVPALCRGPSP